MIDVHGGNEGRGGRHAARFRALFGQAHVGRSAPGKDGQPAAGHRVEAADAGRQIDGGDGAGLTGAAPQDARPFQAGRQQVERPARACDLVRRGAIRRQRRRQQRFRGGRGQLEAGSQVDRSAGQQHAHAAVVRGEVEDLGVEDMQAGLRPGVSAAGRLRDGLDQAGDSVPVDRVGNVRRQVERRREAGARRLQVADVGGQRRDDRLCGGRWRRAHRGTDRQIGLRVGGRDQQVRNLAGEAGAAGDGDVDAKAHRRSGRVAGLGQHGAEPADQCVLVEAGARIDRPLKPL